MKKVLIALLTILTVFSLFFAVSCKENNSSIEEKTITSVEYVSGMPDSAFLSTTPSLLNFKVKVIYSDGSSEEVVCSNANKNEFAIECDTTEIGETSAVVSYKGFELNFTIEVFMDIKAVNLPSFVNYFNTQNGDNSLFTNKGLTYVVGDDGLFYFSPVVYTIIDGSAVSFEEPGEVEIEVVSLSILENEVYTQVEDLANYVEVDTKMASFDFTESAIGKTFKLAVRPAGLNDEQVNNANFTKEFEFKVVDGYNVYNALDLLLWDNKQEVVENFRKNHGLNVDASSLNGLVLHSNIYLTDENLPSNFFYHEDADPTHFAALSAAKKAILEGSLKDWVYIIQRNLGEHGKFNFEGNLFTIDASGIPYIMKEDGDLSMTKEPTSVVSHTSLFTIDSTATTDGCSNTENFAVNNVNLIGNLNRQENAVSSGGLIFVKARQAAGTFNNNISKRWYVSVFVEQNATGHEVDVVDSIIEDAYSSLIYAWGARINVKNCKVNGAGGPAILATHTHTKSQTGRNGPGGWTSEINVDENSTVTSFVTGQEAWFAQFSAQSAVAEVKKLDALFNAFGKTFLTPGDGGLTLVNIPLVIMDGAAEGLSFDPILGKASFGSHALDFSGAYTAPFLAGFAGFGAPVFQGTTQEGILAYAGQLDAPLQMLPKLYTLTGAQSMTHVQFDVSTGTPIPNEMLPLFMNDTGYINLFYATPGSSGYMAIVLGSYKAIA